MIFIFALYVLPVRRLPLANRWNSSRLEWFSAPWVIPVPVQRGDRKGYAGSFRLIGPFCGTVNGSLHISIRVRVRTNRHRHAVTRPDSITVI